MLPSIGAPGVLPGQGQRSHPAMPKDMRRVLTTGLVEGDGTSPVPDLREVLEEDWCDGASLLHGLLEILPSCALVVVRACRVASTEWSHEAEAGQTLHDNRPERRRAMNLVVGGSGDLASRIVRRLRVGR